MTKENSRSKNAVRSIYYNLINKLSSIVLPFLVRAIFIRVIGQELLGLNSLFSSILQVLNLTELGFNDAIVFALYKPVAQNKKTEIEAILNFYRKVYMVIGLLILIVGLSITPFIEFLISGDIPSGVNIYTIFLIYLMNTVISYLFFAYRGALLTAYQRVDVTSKITTVVKFVVNTAQIVVIISTKNIYMYTGALLLGSLLNNVLIGTITRKLFPEIKPKGKLTQNTKNIIKEKIKGLLIYKLCMSSRNSFDSIFLATFVGLSATAIYNNYFYILGAVAAFSSAITESILPSVGNSIVSENIEKNYADMNKINFIYLWIAGFCCICMFNLYQPFTELVFGQDCLFPIGIVFLFCMYFYVLRMGDVRAVYSDAKGLWWENRYRLIAETISNIILNYLLGKFFGVYGIIIATLVTLFIFGFIGASQVLFKYYFVSHSIFEFLKFNAKMGITMFISGTLVTYVCSCVSGSLGLTIIIRGIICLVLVNILFWLAYHKSSIYTESTSWLKERIHLSHSHRKGQL